jgi:hypothetical protein
LAVAVKDPTAAFETPGPERMFSVSPGWTWMTAYGPEGVPGVVRLTGEVADGAGDVEVAEATAGIDEGAAKVSDGRASVDVDVGAGGVADSMAGVREGRESTVGVGLPAREAVQASDETIRRRAAQIRRGLRMRVPFTPRLYHCGEGLVTRAGSRARSGIQSGTDRGRSIPLLVI